MLYVFIVVDLHVAVSSVKPLSVDMETQESIPCTQFSLYKCRTGINSTKVQSS